MARARTAHLLMLVTLILSASGIGPFLHHAGEHPRHEHCVSCHEGGESHIHSAPCGPGEHEHSPFAPCELCSAFFGARAILAQGQVFADPALAPPSASCVEQIAPSDRAPLRVRARDPPIA